ncbi:DUF1120 domain-containing protein [Pseudomonas sp. SDO5271_S396]
MKKLFPPLLAALLLNEIALTSAASTTELNVKGSITPNACQPSLTNGGAIDHGKLPAKNLNVEEITVLPQHHLQLNIRCEGATLLALTTIDNRAGSSIVPGLHGLGLINGNEKLGYLVFSLEDPVSDSGQMRPIMSTNNGASWLPGSNLTYPALIAATGMNNPGNVPVAFTTLDAVVAYYTYIAPSKTLTLTHEVPIDGHATLQLKYL